MMKKEYLEEKKKFILEWMKTESYKPMRKKDIAAILQVPKEDRAELDLVLEALLRTGDVVLDTKGKYHLEQNEITTGTFLGTGRGFGFVTIEGQDEDVYIAEEDTLGALNKDIVKIIILPAKTGRRKEGKVVAVLEHAYKEVVGTFFKRKDYGFVVAEDKKLGSDIFIAKEHTKGAVSGHKVVVSITDYGNGKKNPEGKVTEIIGHINDPSTDTVSILRAFGLEPDFPKEVLQETMYVPEELSEEIVEQLAGHEDGRMDCRNLCMITIDGEDAKDLDDAISLTVDEEGYHLGVHIADVSHYVIENSHLDREARRRGTSVYLIDRVIPMLPHRLSNGICSLNAGCDRFALSCFMDINEQGAVIGHKIAETIIRVDRRMSYTEVNHILEVMDSEHADKQQERKLQREQGKEASGVTTTFQLDAENFKERMQNETGVEDIAQTNTDDVNLFAKKQEAERLRIQTEYATLLPMLLHMQKLALILKEKRKQRGSIDFDFPESKIILDEKGVPVEIKPYERNQATRLIEDFMLIANETVAEDYFWQEIPFVYRCHENPDEEKMKKLGIFINNFGFRFRVKNEIHPKEVQKLLTQIEGTPQEAMIARLTLRSMKQAKYQTECTGHFGLSTRYYCHFTSPIRRYPDLQIHRIIKENLHGKLNTKRLQHYAAILDDVAASSCKTERAAEEAEREIEKLKKAEYMEERIGQKFTGVISGITNWGMYVELPNTVEGMIRLADLQDDYYWYDEEQYMLIGEHTHKTYKLGQTMEVIVAGVDKLLKSVDFLPVK